MKFFTKILFFFEKTCTYKKSQLHLLKINNIVKQKY
jgi:hypothetical protein